MSGAEVLAIVGGVAAFTGLLKNAKDTVSWIRSGPSGEQLAVEICEVELRSELLSELQSALQKRGFKMEDLQSKALMHVIEKVSRRLCDLQDLVNFGESLKNARKRDRTKQAFKQPARMKELQQCLRSLDLDLDLIYKILHMRAFSQTLPGLDPTPMINLAIDAQPSEQLADNENEEIPGSEPTTFRSYPSFHQRSRCSRGICSCSCHHAMGLGYRRNQFQRSPWSSVFTRCNCSFKSFSWVFNAFQRQISFAVSLAYEQSFSFSPTLRVVNIVPNTSPLFVALYRCIYGTMSVESTLTDIQKIVSTGAGSLYDVNREGNNWFEELLHCQDTDSQRKATLGLLTHFTSEKVSLNSERPFLSLLNWIEQGFDTAFLETVLPRTGQTPFIDPTQAHASSFHHWRKATDRWRITPTSDFGFIRALQSFVNHSLDFGGTGPLQHQILAHSPQSVAKYLKRKGSADFIGEKNFLGHSVLHISIDKPKVLRILLSCGFAAIVDAGDLNGITPLMYAAAYDESDSAIELLRAGADPNLKDNSGLTFLYYALCRGNSRLITDVYKFFSSESDFTDAKLSLDQALYYWFYMFFEVKDTNLAGLQSLLEVGARPKRATKNGNTLFHFVRTTQQATILLKYCSPSQEDNQNVAGYTPLMVLSRLHDVELTRNLISLGLPVQKKDRHGWSVLEHVFQAIRPHLDPAPAFQVAYSLLQAGADFGTSGSCQCSCTPQGCDGLRFFLPQIYSQEWRTQNIRRIPWVMEIFLLLRGFQKNGLQVLIQSLIRRQRFDEIGMSHTCCVVPHRYDSVPGPRYFNAQELEQGARLRMDDPDFEELREEQQQLDNELEQYCEKNPKDWEHALIKTISRRVVFLERGSEQFLLSNKSYMTEQETVEQEYQSYFQSDQFEVVHDGSEGCLLDYANDAFDHFPPIEIPDAYTSVTGIEESIQDYLRKTKTLDYGGGRTPSLQGAFLDNERWRLCELFTQEIQAIRLLSNQDADWTLDIVSGDT